MMTTLFALGRWLRESIRKSAEEFWRLGESASERAYAEELRGRTGLDDDAFFDRFYRSTGVPRDIPIRYRRLLESITGENLAALHPQDNIWRIYDGLDFADVIYRIHREFDLSIPLSVLIIRETDEAACPVDRIDGTFDSVVRFVAARSPRHP